jgi:hypothetical protein
LAEQIGRSGSVPGGAVIGAGENGSADLHRADVFGSM